MKSKIIDKEIIQYPYLGKYKTSNKGEEFIVLFIALEKGVVVHVGKDSEWRVGEYKNCWDMDQFEIFYGNIELSNL